MIIKSLSRKSNPSQLITYVSRYLVKENKLSILKDHIQVLLEHNLRNAHTVEEYIAAFKENESYRTFHRKDNTILFHTILSLSPDDKAKVTQPMLTDLARQFIELRGTNCLHLAVAHMEKSHAHIHIVTSGVTVGGKSSRMSRDHFTRLLTSLEEYQQQTYPELTYSQNTHEKTIARDDNQLLNQSTERRKNAKLILRDRLHTMIKHSPSYSVLQQQLTGHQYDIYQRNGRPQGIVVNGMKYRFTSLGIEPQLIAELREHEQMLVDLAELRNTTERPCLTQGKNMPYPKEYEAELLALHQLHSRGLEKDEHTIDSQSDERGMGLPP